MPKRYRVVEFTSRPDGKSDIKYREIDGEGNGVIFGVDWNTAVIEGDFHNSSEPLTVEFNYVCNAHSENIGAWPEPKDATLT